ncbi:hypothetical protein DFH08DRAFT_824690 [Mycena albidolilacea]|uniref:Uncharacterized protein n=1 Tax=Mycena albidolilacea TaxID=1033008 RepID=A0AAD6Z414_9AGAR|nr:hypothetical protein DFH08DRAFT_824690 [Mycena albidolilacea]
MTIGEFPLLPVTLTAWSLILTQIAGVTVLGVTAPARQEASGRRRTCLGFTMGKGKQGNTLTFPEVYKGHKKNFCVCVDIWVSVAYYPPLGAPALPLHNNQVVAMMGSAINRPPVHHPPSPSDLPAASHMCYAAEACVTSLFAVSQRITLPAPLACRLYPRSGPSFPIPSDLPATSRAFYAPEVCVTSLITVSRRIILPAPLACRLYPRSGPSFPILSDLPTTSHACYAPEVCVTSLITVSWCITLPAFPLPFHPLRPIILHPLGSSRYGKHVTPPRYVSHP